jgi:hypothetical protein
VNNGQTQNIPAQNLNSQSNENYELESTASFNPTIEGIIEVMLERKELNQFNGQKR